MLPIIIIPLTLLSYQKHKHSLFPQVLQSIEQLKDKPGEIPASQIVNGVTPIVLNNGKRLWVVTGLNSILTPDAGGEPFCEYRTEVLEKSDGVSPVSEQLHDLDVDNVYGKPGESPGSLVAISVLGTLVGNNPLIQKYDKSTNLWTSTISSTDIDGLVYGKVLKRQIFLSQLALVPTQAYLATSTPLEEDQLASAFHLSFPQSEFYGQALRPTQGILNPKKTVTTFDINKEGKLFFNISASSINDNLGEGSSVEGNIDGGTKLALGRDTTTETSLQFDTDGKIKGTVGADDSAGQEEAINITTKGGISLLIQKSTKSLSAMKITILQGNFEIDASAGGGDLDLKTTSSSIKIDGATGDIAVSATKGDINMTALKGDINATALKGNIKAQTTTGQIQLQGPALPLSGVVTQKHICAFTGKPHPQGSTDVLAT